MKKIIFFVLVSLISFSASTLLAGNDNPIKPTEKPATTVTSKAKLTPEQLTQLNNRSNEIRQMDKTKLTSAERKDLRKENKEIKQAERRDGGYIIIGGSTLLVIIILLIILL
ncbi:MAG: hypothetical protein HXX13_01865 [Bacteroidetes bacterium]|nr:hypothetical protein [Bacteroidota bacterium]